MRGGGNDPAGQASCRRPARPGPCRHTLIVLFGLVNFCGRALGSGRSVREREDLGRSRRRCATGARCAVTHAEGHRRVGFARGTFTGAGRAARAAGRHRAYPITILSFCSPSPPARDCAQARLCLVPGGDRSRRGGSAGSARTRSRPRCGCGRARTGCARRCRRWVSVAVRGRRRCGRGCSCSGQLAATIAANCCSTQSGSRNWSWDSGRGLCAVVEYTVITSPAQTTNAGPRRGVRR